jgi:hypothetical protein
MDQVMNICDWYLMQGVNNVIGFHRIIAPRLMGRAPDETAIAEAPDDSRRLLTRGGFFSPSLDGGLPLLLLFNPSRRSSSANRYQRGIFGPQCLDGRFAARRGSDVALGASVVGRCHRHVAPYSAMTCQWPPSTRDLGSYKNI